MAQAYWSSAFTNSADERGAVVRRINGPPDWHPAIQDSAIVEGESKFTPGAFRVLTGPDGNTYREELVAPADARRTSTHEMVDAPLLVSGYRSAPRSGRRRHLRRLAYGVVYDCKACWRPATTRLPGARFRGIDEFESPSKEMHDARAPQSPVRN
jgi:hypothetical protein